MKKKWLFALILFCSCLIFTLPVHATLITFDSVPSSGNPEITTLTTDGFTFTSGHFHTVDNPAIGNFGGLVGNGTIYIVEEAGGLGQPITMMNSSGLPFSLSSFAGAEVFLNDALAISAGFPNATGLKVDGVLLGGGTLTISFGLDGLKDGNGGIADFQTFMLPSSWTDLTSVTFSGLIAGGGTGGISLDNINASAVPLPPTMLLLGSGLLGLVGWKRFRKG